MSQTFELPSFSQAQGLVQAMTHKSFHHERGEALAPAPGQPDLGDNERLEFLGDAILTFLCGEFLYREFPDCAEGELTPLRASLVDKAQLAVFATWIGLAPRLRLGRGVENSGGRQNPRLLCSAFEALVGAYFLDQESDIRPVRCYVEPFFRAALAQRGSSPARINVKSQLQEWALAQGKPIPHYAIAGESGPDHAKVFVAEVYIGHDCYGQGQGPKKQAAEKQAAHQALLSLGLL